MSYIGIMDNWDKFIFQNKQKHNSNLVYINNIGTVHGGLGVYKD